MAEFVCGVREKNPDYLSACKNLPEYRDTGYCVLHFPGEEKKEDFEQVKQSKLVREDYDFSGTVFPEGTSDFSIFVFDGNAHFTGATFVGRADFSVAQFSGESTSFASAQFSGERTSFQEAHFSGYTWFQGAQFSGERTVFEGAQFSGEGTVFQEGHFSGEWTSFVRAQFRGEWRSIPSRPARYTGPASWGFLGTSPAPCGLQDDHPRNPGKLRRRSSCF